MFTESMKVAAVTSHISTERTKKIHGHTQHGQKRMPWLQRSTENRHSGRQERKRFPKLLPSLDIQILVHQDGSMPTGNI